MGEHLAVACRDYIPLDFGFFFNNNKKCLTGFKLHCKCGMSVGFISLKEMHGFLPWCLGLRSLHLKTRNKCKLFGHCPETEVTLSWAWHTS